MKHIVINIARVILTLIAIAALAIGNTLYESTLIYWWFPPLLSLLIAGGTSFLHRRWQWLTYSNKKIINIICHLCFVGAFSYLLFFLGNHAFASKSFTHKEEVRVVSKYIEKIKMTRRGKHYYYDNTNPRKKYYMRVIFNNGTEKDLHISAKTYNKVKVNSSRSLTLQEGGFGFPIIKSKF